LEPSCLAGRIDTITITACSRAHRGLSSAFFRKELGSARWRESLSGFFILEATVELAFEKQGGLLPAVIQDYGTKEVLMVGYLNADALAKTQLTGEVHFFSRSRKRIWKKGETSGHVLRLRELRFDCDADALLILVEPLGPGVCHEGYRSCFFRQLELDGTSRVISERTFIPEDVYGQKGSQ
jgi:phosphoribosyl-AMP cyclohydrolase